MERVLQVGDEDCGVACVAMLIQRYAGCAPGSSYDAAKAVMFGKKPVTVTSTRDLHKALGHFGIEAGQKRVPFTPTDPKDMGLAFDAIIATEPEGNEGWHWMVWDAEARILLDPDGTGEETWVPTHYVWIHGSQPGTSGG